MKVANMDVFADSRLIRRNPVIIRLRERLREYLVRIQSVCFWDKTSQL